MMNAAHGNLAGPLQSPNADAKAGAGGGGFTGAPSDEKGFNNMPTGVSSGGGNALGMGGAGRIGLEGPSNALTVSKRLPKEETV